MKLMALNWRDMNHPEAGGAEVHLHEILSYLVSKGHQATLISSAFPGCREEETLEGIRIIRGGHWFDANFTLPRLARKYLSKNRCDVILEDINKVPFYMPLYTDVPVVPVIPHLFGTTVFRESNFLVGSYVLMMEKLIPLIYRNCRFMVISPSTRDDLVERGIPPENIQVILCGLDHRRYRHMDLERFEQPTIVHLGRLRKYKGIEIVMAAMKSVTERIPSARLVVIGDGPYRKNLEGVADRMGLDHSVSFMGYMEGEEVVKFLNRSHLLFNASPKEGWGLTIVEANACGLPVVASDSPGLRDSVRHGETGFLVPYGDSRAFADRAVQLFQDKELWRKMSDGALQRVRELTWERCGEETERFLEKILSGSRDS